MDSPNTVLIVDDDSMIRQLYKSILESTGFRVVEAENYPDAIAHLQQEHVDLALLDLRLAGKESGLDILRYTRKHHPECPCIMISAYADKQNAIEALRAGAADYLEKQVDSDELIHVLRYWTSHVRFKRSDARLKDCEAVHQSLQVSESKYQKLVERSPSIVYSYSAKRGGLFYSKQAAKILGYSLEYLYSHPFLWIESIHSDDRARVIQAIQSCQVDRPFELEYRIQDALGNWLWFYDRSICRREESGDTIIDGVADNITVRKQAELDLKKKEYLLAESQRLAHIGSWSVSTKDNSTCWTDETYRIFGVKPELFTPNEDSLLTLIHPADREAMREWISDCLTHSHPDDLEFRSIRPDGTVRFLRGGGDFQPTEDGVSYRLLGTLQDITEKKLTEDELRIAAITFESHDPILITDAQGNILRVNQAFSAVTGYAAGEVIGRNPRIMSSGKHERDFYIEMWQQILHRGAWSGEIYDKRKNGEIFPKWMTITAVKNSQQEVTHYVAIFNDITERKKAEAEIQKLAFYDPLTQLPNRRLLLDRFSTALPASARNNEYGATLFIDLDYFKVLNDTLGHEYGDLLLQEVAVRIKTCIREMDTVSRFGGDEFVVLLESVDKDREDAIRKVGLVAEKIREVLARPYQLREHEHICSPSIGASLFYGHNEGVDALIKQADDAMYQAKLSGRNAVRFYDSNRHESVENKDLLELNLKQAIECQQLQLYFQLQVDKENHPIGAEAFLRWLHPERGLIMPDRIFAAAAKNNLTIDVGNWVLHEACRQLSAWSKHEKTRNLILTINISEKEFAHSNFVGNVLNVLNRYQIKPTLLKMELPEDAVLTNISTALAKIKILSDLDIKLSVGDFVSFYTALIDMKNLTSSRLKISRELLPDISGNPGDEYLMKIVVDLAKLLYMDIAAEGIETEEQFAFLQKNYCVAYQGAVIGAPVSLAEFDAQLT